MGYFEFFYGATKYRALFCCLLACLRPPPSSVEEGARTSQDGGNAGADEVARGDGPRAGRRGGYGGALHRVCEAPYVPKPQR